MFLTTQTFSESYASVKGNLALGVECFSQITRAVEGVFKTRNGEMAKWRNDEMAKWRNGEIELKTRATVIKYELPSEIGSCFHPWACLKHEMAK